MMSINYNTYLASFGVSIAPRSAIMRVIVQKVRSAKVTIRDDPENLFVSGEIGFGLLVLLGIAEGDIQHDYNYIVSKVLTMRIFPAEDGKPWRRNVMQVGGGVLVVSQFTLHGFLKGNRPDFHLSMPNHLSKPMFEGKIMPLFRSKYPGHIQAGVFGAYMSVALENDGPVTISLDSRKQEYAQGVEEFSKMGGHKAYKAAQKALQLREKEKEQEKAESE
eukprot:gnl/Dysnectes_brevis/3892_a5036_1036.p1 GENE.gnl/Dysnectes_brevis/3892_a5036_1036~~gnl/Dysnectes_brevis/3892_a5036_1036.p1  ORF type:complete len:219 (+),score=26.93 gnl/Dysnectes_brevis/3892_a5036_1036:74-730(+)